MILIIYTVLFIFVFLLLLSSDFKKKKHFNKKIKVTVCFLLWFQFSFSRRQYSITGMKNKVTQWWLIPEVSYLTHNNNNNNANNTSPLFCLSHTALYNQNWRPIKIPNRFYFPKWIIMALPHCSTCLIFSIYLIFFFFYLLQLEQTWLVDRKGKDFVKRSSGNGEGKKNRLRGTERKDTKNQLETKRKQVKRTTW